MSSVSMVVPAVRVHGGVVVWFAGSSRRPVDVWFHPALGDSSLTYRQVFASQLIEHARVFVYDPPGHGASPPLPEGLTVERAARVWCTLVGRFSGSRDVALVGHSMAGVIASQTARLLPKPPVMVIGVDANLTPADAYFTGLAAQFDEPAAFLQSLRSRVEQIAPCDVGARVFACSLHFADALTLWTLGRSLVRESDPGEAFRRLRCPKLHYWDAAGTSQETRDYIDRHRLPNRMLEGTGHWPMSTAAAAFYGAIATELSEGG
jgi:pimeloyl-ACP methyl ester carboxylesterase